MEREEVVRRVVDTHPEFHANPDRDAAKMALLPFVILALNQNENTENWGFLVKTDQGGKIPNDIVCWKPTREIVDVLSDDGAIWDMKGVAPNPAWVWGPIPTKQPPVDIPPTTDPAPSLEELVQEIVSRVSTFVGHEADRIIAASRQDMAGIYAQNERIFADLTRQNQELKNLLIQVSGRDFAVNPGAALTPLQAALGASDSTKTVHISQQSIERIISVGAPLLARLLSK